MVENYIDCKIDHIQIRNTSIIFLFDKSNSNQNREEHVGLWHVYVDPDEPHICVLLALAH